MNADVVQQGVKIGFLSRIDYGSSGFRRAILESAFAIFQDEGVHFNVLAGGLVNQAALKREMEDWIKPILRKDKEGKKNYSRFAHLSGAERTGARKKELEEKFLRKTAQELSQLIPKLPASHRESADKEECVDLFISTSPAFDGDIGELVAQMLSEIRSDIKVWNAGGDRHFARYVDKTIWVLTPRKGVWMRSDYHSTPVERVIKDRVQQTSQSKPDMFVIGCFASNIHKPQGELPYQYISVGGAHRLEETRVSENQISVSILEYVSHDTQPIVRTYNLKDSVARELSYIVPPKGASELQRKLIEFIKERGWATKGMFRYAVKDLECCADLSTEDLDKKIADDLQSLMRAKTERRRGENWPGLTYQEGSKKYYLDLSWIQDNLKYDISKNPVSEDRILSFACLHAGSIETDYKFFVETVPEIVLRNGVTTLVGAGDIIEGMNHDLDRMGEVVAGCNNHTLQEKLAAGLVGQVIITVFQKLFISALEKTSREQRTEGVVRELVRESLLNFHYIPGNHDDWQKREGHTPLAIFQFALVELVEAGIEQIFAMLGIAGVRIRDIVREKITKGEFFTLPSGLKVSIQHPHMARAKTTSIRPQEMLDFAKRQKCQIAIGGNFHVSEKVEVWDLELGQCVCMEIGTIKHGSNFERHKMKSVDQGVAYLRVKSQKVKHNGGPEQARIFMTESAFEGGPVRPPVDNLAIVNKAFIEPLGIPPLAGDSPKSIK